jgi:hypothetical protein
MFACRRKLTRAVGFPLICLAMFSLAGGHWAVLQTIAWARMLQEYSREATFALALKKTFGGEYPCNLCRKVEEGRQKEEKAPATAKAEKKAEVFLFAGGVVAKAPPVQDASYPFPADVSVSLRFDPPPSPIPIV